MSGPLFVSHALMKGGSRDERPAAQACFGDLWSVIAACPSQVREPGLGPAAEVLVLCFAKEKYPKERRPRCPCPPRRWRGGSLRCSVLGCTAELAAFALRVNSAQTTAVSQTTMRVSFGTRSPQALRFSARSEGGGSGLHTGHCFARPRGPSLRSARQSARASCVGSAQRVTDTRRSCAAAAVFDPAPHPFWLRREAQELGWACVPKDTHASSSSLPQLFERSSKNAASSAAPPQFRASQVARSEAEGRRLGVAFYLPTFFWRRKRKWVRRRAHIPASALGKATAATIAPNP
ncbi:hypothetical protein HNP48_002200 [Acidovorax soli]|uniref:Uncharacterized protein n=1 Tax=Acidovorax soli TaxID=592050 RepID=A0A7X0PCR8_9BURK|nr:hypothetical protein [Acidovorax soli]